MKIKKILQYILHSGRGNYNIEVSFTSFVFEITCVWIVFMRSTPLRSHSMCVYSFFFFTFFCFSTHRYHSSNFKFMLLRVVCVRSFVRSMNGLEWGHWKNISSFDFLCWSMHHTSNKIVSIETSYRQSQLWHCMRTSVEKHGCLWLHFFSLLKLNTFIHWIEYCLANNIIILILLFNSPSQRRNINHSKIRTKIKKPISFFLMNLPCVVRSLLTNVTWDEHVYVSSHLTHVQSKTVAIRKPKKKNVLILMEFAMTGFCHYTRMIVFRFRHHHCNHRHNWTDWITCIGICTYLFVD